MNLQLHDVVALLEDTRTEHFETGDSLLLRRGQIGTIVMSYDDGAREVEFSDRDGRAFALLSLSPSKLMVLYDSPEHAAA